MKNPNASYIASEETFWIFSPGRVKRYGLDSGALTSQEIVLLDPEISESCEDYDIDSCPSDCSISSVRECHGGSGNTGSSRYCEEASYCRVPYVFESSLEE